MSELKTPRDEPEPNGFRLWAPGPGFDAPLTPNRPRLSVGSRYSRPRGVTFREPGSRRPSLFPPSSAESLGDNEMELLAAVVSLFSNAGVKHGDLRAVDEVPAADAASEESARTLELPEFPAWRNCCRRLCLTNAWFERFWFLVILLNCATLAMEDPTDHDCDRFRCKFTTVTDYIFTCLFTVECGIKIAGLTFYARHDAYIRDEWNVLDFLIVVSGDAALLLDLAFGVTGPGLTALRAFRVLRPLKTMQAFPSVRVLVQSILASVPQLLDVFVLYSFFVLCMGIIAIDQWKGLLRRRCVDNGWDESWDRANATTTTDPKFRHTSITQHIDPSEDRVCQTRAPDLGGHYCRWGYRCMDSGTNPHWDQLGFDHIGVAGLALFTAISLEGWSDSMYLTMDATTYFAALFWVVLIMFGSFFILNLTIVIITEAFEKKQDGHRAQIFHAVDRRRRGELDREEVRVLLERKIGRKITDDELDFSFATMDTDKGGTVSLEEFLRWEHTRGGSSFVRPSRVKGIRKRFMWCLGHVCSTGFVESVRQCALSLRQRARREMDPQRHRTPRREAVYQVVTVDAERAVDHPKLNWLFRRTIVLAIILNTCTLGTEHYRQPEWMTDMQYWSNFVFTVVFTGEAGLKIFGMGFLEYLGDWFNAFDLLIVSLSWVDLITSGGGADFSVFRAFRVLRVLKLARQFPSLQRWVQILASSLRNAAVLTGLLALLVFIVALLGMQLFGGEYCWLDDSFDRSTASPEQLRRGEDCGGVPRSNYDTLWNAFITTFQILTGEDWNVVMYTGMRAKRGWAAVYFVIYYVIGNYLMLNLFIAVLLNNRDLKERGSEAAGRGTQADPALMSGLSSPRSASAVLSESGRADGGQNGALQRWKKADPYDSSPAASPNGVLQRGMKRPADPATAPAYLAQDTRDVIRRRDRRPEWLRKRMESPLRFGFLPPTHRLCVALTRCVESTVFESVVLLAITCSTVVLAMEDPFRAADHELSRKLNTINFAMVWVFLAELVVKMLAYGAFLHPDSYWRRESWNRLDLLIVVVSLLSVGVPGASQYSFIMIVRTLRPLRFINKSQGMKVAVGSLVKSVGPLMNVVVISFLLFLIFGILGVQMFSGAFYRCTMDTYGDKEPGVNGGPVLDTQQLCENKTLCPDVLTGDATNPVKWCKWDNAPTHFDHLGKALLALFTMASLEGWVVVMYRGVDARGPELAPRIDENPANALYFIVFITFGSFFIINMFIGVLIDTYYREKEKSAEAGGFLLLNEGQRKWVENHRRMLDAMQDETSEEVRVHKLRFVTSTWFETFIIVCIVLNIIAMASEHYPSSQTYEDAMRWENLVFVGVFTAEAALKIAAFSFRRYIKDNWNRLDFSIVVLSVAGVVAQEVADSDMPVISVFRVLRLTRLLRMVKRAKGIKRILRTLFLSIPSLLNVAGLLFLMYFIYATLGVKLFSKVRRGGNMGPYANFENFGFSLLLLLRMSTGEAWQDVLEDLSGQHDCHNRLDNCGIKYVATAYFCTFTFGGMYVFLNLFIAVILDNFSEVGDTIDDDHVARFKQVWYRHAVRSQKRPDVLVIEQTNIEEFLRELGPPLGPTRGITRKKMMYYVIRLRLPPYRYLHRGEMLEALLRGRYHTQRLPSEQEQKLRKLTERVVGGRRASEVSDTDDGYESISRQYATVRVQALLRSWIARRRLQRKRAKKSFRRPKHDHAEVSGLTGASFATTIPAGLALPYIESVRAEPPASRRARVQSPPGSLKAAPGVTSNSALPQPLIQVTGVPTGRGAPRTGRAPAVGRGLATAGGRVRSAASPTSFPSDLSAVTARGTDQGTPYRSYPSDLSRESPASGRGRRAMRPTHAVMQPVSEAMPLRSNPSDLTAAAELKVPLLTSGAAASCSSKASDLTVVTDLRSPVRAVGFQRSQLRLPEAAPAGRRTSDLAGASDAAAGGRYTHRSGRLGNASNSTDATPPPGSRVRRVVNSPATQPCSVGRAPSVGADDELLRI
eukprot:TRINITY_DN5379_c0_g1_i2.p1 TRINITY_DN5379_c0_g1~~TRINITY_DN5379_c0_g1_i2.p1  ORF type:complete len:1990 (+),score=713.92 TRINITY_DN5379_c0_g1_i2:31-6000(+)